MALLALFGAMLVLMLLRVALPLGVRIPGEPVGQITLTLGERVRLQRVNVYAIGVVLLVAVLSGELPTAVELLTIVGVGAILMLPARYVLTSDGIAFNRVVFRPWSDFRQIEVAPGRITLIGQPGMRPFRLVLRPAKTPEVRATLQRYVTERRPERPRPTGVLRRA